ncbi:MAG: cysteine--tRNA ligase [Pseudomonadota bacterium]
MTVEFSSVIPLLLHNTQAQQRTEFIPKDFNNVTMYVCGPTVYNRVHIGNARPMVVFDVLVRLLKQRYPNVRYGRNLTDVDDKINAAAAVEGIDIRTLTDRYIQAFHEDMAELNVLPPNIEPRATEHMSAMLNMIQQLIDQEFAYVAEGHVLFHVPSYTSYGKLSNRSVDDMIAGARVEVAPYKKHPADFVLWKPSSPEQPGWDSPWGRGRPGWHIECSAMIFQHFGSYIDIHGGGQDLIFPHHENERAQSCCAHQVEEFVGHWLHNGYLTTGGEKMAKSTGNFTTVRALLDHYSGETLRYALLSAHYRSPLEWTESTLQQAQQSLSRCYIALRDSGFADSILQLQIDDDVQAVENALCDDLNTVTALAALHRLAQRVFKADGNEEKAQLGYQLKQAGSLLGLLQSDPNQWLTGKFSDNAISAEAIEALIVRRNEARKNRDFKTADSVREELLAMGIVLEDSVNGTRWRSESNG